MNNQPRRGLEQSDPSEQPCKAPGLTPGALVARGCVRPSGAACRSGRACCRCAPRAPRCGGLAVALRAPLLRRSARCCALRARSPPAPACAAALPPPCGRLPAPAGSPRACAPPAAAAPAALRPPPGGRRRGLVLWRRARARPARRAPRPAAGWRARPRSRPALETAGAGPRAAGVRRFAALFRPAARGGTPAVGAHPQGRAHPRGKIKKTHESGKTCTKLLSQFPGA